MAGCGDDGGGGPSPGDAGDAGRPDGGSAQGPEIAWLEEGAPPVAEPGIPWLDDGAPAVAAPAVPWLAAGHPPARPCPTGWRTTTGADGEGFCDAYPATGVASCGAGQAHFPGTPGCAPVGAACPAGDWPSVSDLPGGTTVRYVRAGEVGGDGSSADPFGSLDAALAGIASGAVVVLSSGTYALSGVIPRGVSIRGKCAAETVLVEGTLTQTAVVSVEGGTSTVQGVRIEPTFVAGVYAIGATSDVRLRGVEIRGAYVAGILAQTNAKVDAADLVVADTDGLVFMSLPLGFGVSADSGADVTITRGVIEGNLGVGATVANDGSTLTLTDVLVADSRAFDAEPFDGALGWGVFAAEGGDATLVRAAFEGNRDLGLVASGAGSVVTATDVLVRDTLEGPADTGVGLSAIQRGRLVVTGAWIERNASQGVGALDGGELDLTDLVVRDNGTLGADPPLGDGVAVSGADTGAQIERATFVRNARQALAATDGALIDAVDVSARGLPLGIDGDLDRGAVASGGATLILRRALIERMHTYGVIGVEPETEVTLEDLVIRGTRASRDGFAGNGLRIRTGADATLRRALVEDNEEAGVCISDGRLEASDLVVRGTTWGPPNGCFGYLPGTTPASFGVSFARDGTGVIERAIIEDNEHYGLYLQGVAVEVELRDVLVRGTKQPSDPSLGAFGIRASNGSTLDAERLLVEDNEHTGLGLGGDDEGTTEVSLRDVVLRRHTALDSLLAGAGASGFGLWASRRSNLVFERLRVEQSTMGALSFSGPDLAATLRDVAVRDVAGSPDGRGGYAIAMYGGGAVEIERALVERAHQVGIYVASGRDAPAPTSFEALDVAVFDTRGLDQPDVSAEDRGTRGWGLSAEDSVAITLERVLLDGNREIGLGSSARDDEGANASLVATDVLVRDTRPADCGAACSDRPPGVGLATWRAGRSRISRFLIEGSAFCGVQVASDGEVDLASGRIEGHPVAVCLARGDYDLSRLQNDVQYVDNEGTIETVEVTVPEPAALLAALPPIESLEPSDDQP